MSQLNSPALDSKAHWFLKRTYDPVGKMLYDLSYLQFRRTLLLAMTLNASEVRVCVHNKCRETFDKIEFFEVRGAKHPVLEVENRDAAIAAGAQAYICSCPKVNDGSERLLGRKFNDV